MGESRRSAGRRGAWKGRRGDADGRRTPSQESRQRKGGRVGRQRRGGRVGRQRRGGRVGVAPTRGGLPGKRLSGPSSAASAAPRLSPSAVLVRLAGPRASRSLALLLLFLRPDAQPRQDPSAAHRARPGPLPPPTRTTRPDCRRPGACADPPALPPPPAPSGSSLVGARLVDHDAAIAPRVPSFPQRHPAATARRRLPPPASPSRAAGQTRACCPRSDPRHLNLCRTNSFAAKYRFTRKPR